MTIDELESVEAKKVDKPKLLNPASASYDWATDRLKEGKCPTCGGEVKVFLMGGAMHYTCKVHAGHMFFRGLQDDDGVDRMFWD